MKKVERIRVKTEFLNYILEKYKIKNGQKIEVKLLNQIMINESIESKDMFYLFGITHNSLYRIKNKGQKFIVVNFNKNLGLSGYKVEYNQKIKLDNFNDLMKKYNLKKYTLMKKLGVSRYMYKKLEENETEYILIKNVNKKHIVNMIKIDLKYLKKYGYRYYDKNELNKICYKRKINYEDFLQYYSKNIRQLKLNKEVLEKSAKGLWIGGKIKMPEDFFVKNVDKIQNGLKKIIRKYNIIYKWFNYGEDLIQEALINMYNKFGDIVKIFDYDKDVLMNVLYAKSRYFMVGKYQKEFKYNYISIYEENVSRSYRNRLMDNRYNPDKLIYE